jgi:RNA polymerase sigma factor (sigma-70 family)
MTARPKRAPRPVGLPALIQRGIDRAERERPRRAYSTEEAAGLLQIQPQSLRAALCRDGHYAGIVPRKLPSRFLAWPADQVDAIVRGKAEESLIRQELANNITKLLELLSPREASVLSMRFGLDGEEHSIAACAKKMGVSSCRVSQIEAKAMRKIRAGLSLEKARELLD